MPDRCSSGVHAVAYTSNDATCNHLSYAESGDLQDCADGHDRGTNEDRIPAPKSFAEGEGRDGTEEASNVVDGSHGREQGSVLGAGEVKGVQKILGDDDTTKDSLVFGSSETIF